MSSILGDILCILNLPRTEPMKVNHMAIAVMTTLDLINIASAGGGMRINAAPKNTLDLINIAAAAGKSGAKIVFVGVKAKNVIDLINIANAGKGNVSFED